MDSCCKVAYNNTFDIKRASVELKNYLRNGPKKTTNYLLEPIGALDLNGITLLDIGSGTGAIIWELSKQGITKAYYNEISDAYAKIFREEMEKRDTGAPVEIKIGDFVEQEYQYPQVDLVTLDKVICCYEDYRSLVRASITKARKYYAYTLPLDVWWVKAVIAVETFFRKLAGNKIRTYAHPVSEIEDLVTKQRFVKIHQKQHREWLTVVFERSSN